MDDLITFLTVRLDEDERIARRGVQWLDESAPDLTDFDRAAQRKRAFDVLGVGGILPDRVLREVEAKRRILDEHPILTAGRVCTRCSDYAEPGEVFREVPGPCATVRLLALPYTDHDDYREEWKP